MGILPTSDNDRLATHKDVQLATQNVQLTLTTLITEKIGEVNEEIAALQAATTRWMFTMLITIIAAMAAVYFAP